jgi:hypothetical protein
MQRSIRCSPAPSEGLRGKTIRYWPANIVLQPTALRRARSELFCVKGRKAAAEHWPLARHSELP